MSVSDQPVRSRRWLTASAVLILASAGASVLHACSVPVFRYALEHWQSDPYVAIVFHRGALSSEDQLLVDKLDPVDESGRSIANIVVRSVDLDDDPSETILELWEQHETEELPLLSLQTSPKLGRPETAWFGTLNEFNVEHLLESPARWQISERLLEGHSVVWVLLESGDPTEDNAAFELLNQTIQRLQKEIELPAIDEADLSDLSVDPAALKLAFSSIRVARDDNGEDALVRMLLHVEPDLLNEPYVQQTMAFPIFGRGRALYALVGDGITAETIEDASRFLAGACQCTVKAQNPGVDLLMAVDWDRHVAPALPYDETQPSLAGLTSFARPMSDGAQSGATGDPDKASATNSSEDDALPTAPLATSLQSPLPDPGSNDISSPDVQPHEKMSAAAVDTGVESLVDNIALLLGLIVAGVVLATVLILMKWR